MSPQFPACRAALAVFRLLQLLAFRSQAELTGGEMLVVRLVVIAVEQFDSINGAASTAQRRQRAPVQEV